MECNQQTEVICCFKVQSPSISEDNVLGGLLNERRPEHLTLESDNVWAPIVNLH